MSGTDVHTLPSRRALRAAERERAAMADAVGGADLAGPARPATRRERRAELRAAQSDEFLLGAPHSAPPLTSDGLGGTYDPGRAVPNHEPFGGPELGLAPDPTFPQLPLGSVPQQEPAAPISAVDHYVGSPDYLGSPEPGPAPFGAAPELVDPAFDPLAVQYRVDGGYGDGGLLLDSHSASGFDPAVADSRPGSADLGYAAGAPAEIGWRDGAYEPGATGHHGHPAGHDHYSDWAESRSGEQEVWPLADGAGPITPPPLPALGPNPTVPSPGYESFESFISEGMAEPVAPPQTGIEPLPSELAFGSVAIGTNPEQPFAAESPGFVGLDQPELMPADPLGPPADPLDPRADSLAPAAAELVPATTPDEVPATFLAEPQETGRVPRPSPVRCSGDDDLEPVAPLPASRYRLWRQLPQAGLVGAMVAATAGYAVVGDLSGSSVGTEEELPEFIRAGTLVDEDATQAGVDVSGELAAEGTLQPGEDGIIRLRSDEESSRSGVRALLPECDGFVPELEQLNGRMDNTYLCELWDDGHYLRADAAVAFAQLNEAYRVEYGRDICITDSYRDFGEQVTLRELKGRLAAVPGTSNHGLGLATDLCGGVNTAGAPYWWLRENAPAYGWDNPAWARSGGSGIYEPWHWEYFPGVEALEALE